MVQWLGLHLAMEGVQVLSLVREQGSLMPHGQGTTTQSRNSAEANSIKTLKKVHVKKIFTKAKRTTRQK